MSSQTVTLDANKAVAHVAYKTNEVISIYPITPASPMGEHADSWSVKGKQNIWGSVPDVDEMQAEGGAAGAVHGSLQGGSLTTTFTASQGLLLMVPNMYKIAGELTSTVFHIAARSVASHALSIFCDHSDVMTTRGTGWGMLFSNSAQEAQDMALIAQAATLEARVPFLHVFDGFRTSHEIRKFDQLTDEQIRSLIPEDKVREHRRRGMTPEDPVVRGTAQNPDVFFQSREHVNPYYRAVPDIVQSKMDEFESMTGRKYRPYEYVGSPEADRVIVLMGSGADAAHETVEALNQDGEDVGVLKVRMFRPFSPDHFLEVLPPSVESITALDRTKEPGGAGEPLYQDVVTAVQEGHNTGVAPFDQMPRVTGGRYGLGSKEFTPSMIKGVFDEMAKSSPKNHFTVGIRDDVTHTSLDYDPDFSTESEDTFRGVFWGLGSDGTVSANKNSIKIIGQETDNHAQGYFVYDSKKAGARTVSHLRFGPAPIRSTYQIKRANFVAVHQYGFLEQYNRFNCLEVADDNATFLLNSPHEAGDVWEQLPEPVQETILERDLEMYVIDAHAIASEQGLGNRINTIMQTAFFDITDILPTDQAVEEIKQAIRDSYGKRGETVVQKNFNAVNAALENVHPAAVPEGAGEEYIQIPPVVPEEAPQFVREVTADMLAGHGDDVPVSKLPDDGTYPTDTSRWEKRNLAQEIPVWDEELCIQCGKCVVVCPHAVIRGKVFDKGQLEDAPEGFKHADARFPGLDGDEKQYTLQVAVEDCTGCSLCYEVCPAKDKSQAGRRAINMEPQRPRREEGKQHWEYFRTIDNSVDRTSGLNFDQAKNSQLLEPLFEFHGACAGCGETPYIRLLTEHFGDRSVIANATGCSSIYGGNLPTHPWATNDEGRGPAWNNSLFEDNAEFGFGLRLATDKQMGYARSLVESLSDEIGEELATAVLEADQSEESGVEKQRKRIEQLRDRLEDREDPRARDLFELADKLVKNNVWIVGGDGWAYDIGYGGLDHVMASGRDVNILVLDTEVYSNTGGQASKATPQGAAAKFAMGGKPTPKKDLGMRGMMYGDVYVAQVALGKDDTQTIKALREAESYDGTSLVIAYSTCIAHGIDMAKGMDQMERAVDSGHWPIYRYDPRRREEGGNPLQLDFRGPSIPLEEYMYKENRFRMLKQSDPDTAKRLLDKAQENVNRRWTLYQQLAEMDEDGAPDESDASDE